MKRCVALILALVLLMGSVPVHATEMDEQDAFELVSSDEIPQNQITEETEPIPTVEIIEVALDPGLPENDELFGAYVEKVFYGNSFSSYGTAAGERLTGDEKVMYDALVPFIKQIAAGQRSSTVIGVGKTVTAYVNGVPTVFKADVGATFEGTSFDRNSVYRIIDALLSDLPYEMYWYDKTIGYSLNLIGTETELMQVVCSFIVAKNYRASSNTQVNTQKASAATVAAANAAEVVKKYAGKSDYDKLAAYRDEICDLVTYDFETAYGGSFSYNNDPWQLIYVFDNDSSTNVVCEGYSKAFMYLCDLTEFSGDVSCYTVTGTMDGGGHMWNIVTLDGKNYLVDITNSDDRTIGADGSLYLAGAVGSPSAGYVIKGSRYRYDEGTLNLWGSDKESILTLAEESYSLPEVPDADPCANGHSYTPWMVVTAPTCTEKGSERRDCENCDAFEIREVTEKGHNHQSLVTAPTCTEKGYTTHTCACGDSFIDTYIDAKNHIWDAGVVSVAPTEESSGIRTYTCTVCGETRTEEIPVLDHAHMYSSVLTAPTCTEKGYTTYECAVCGDKYVDNFVDATNHSFAQWNTTIECTCTQNGSERRDCENCDHFETREIVTEGHDYQVAVTAPTCAESGYTTHTCSICGDNYIDTYVDAVGHSHEGKKYEPTYTKQGYTEYVCACGDSYIDNYTKPLGLPKPVITAEANPATGGAILRWEAKSLIPDDADEADSYKVYCKTSSKGKYSLVATVTEPEAEVSVGVGKKYYYKVVAVCSANSKLNSGDSNVVSYTGKCAAPVVTVSATASTGKPYLKWNKVSSAKKYYVYRLDEATGALTSLGTTTKTYFTDSKAAVGTTYTYQVRAYPSKSTYKGALSEPVSCLCICGQPAVSISISSTTGKPTVSWKAVSGAVSYDIYRSTNGTDFELLTNQTGISYVDIDATPDTDYWYKVNAIAAEESLNSVEGTGKKVHTTLAKPVVTFGNDEKTGRPKLSWEAVEGAVSYKIYRSSYSTKKYKAIATVTGTEYTNSVSVGKGYYYKVIAIGAKSSSAYSSYKKLYGKCAQPDVTVTTNSSGKPYLKWGKVTSAKKYYVYRVNTETGALTSMGTTTKTYFTDSKAVLGTTYSYQVRAYPSKSTYKGAYSEVDSCLTILAQPSVTVSTVAATGKPTVKWSAVTGATGYELYRSENGGEYQLIDTAGAMSYTDEAAVLNSKYSYKVKEIGTDAALNNESAEKTITCTCGNPTISGKLNGKKPMVSWEPVEGATKYYVYRSTKKSGGEKKIATVEGESFTDKKASKGKTYYYKVIAVTETGATSAYSNDVRIKSK